MYGSDYMDKVTHSLCAQELLYCVCYRDLIKCQNKTRYIYIQGVLINKSDFLLVAKKSIILL